MAGGSVAGACNSYFSATPDIPNNANMQITQYCCILQQASETASARSVPMPASARIHTDNTASEGKNQVCMKWCAWLAKYLFKVVDMDQFMVGHTHDETDQDFSVARHRLNREARLDTICDFAGCLRDVPPKVGCKRLVEVITGVHDWTTFFFKVACGGQWPDSHCTESNTWY